MARSLHTKQELDLGVQLEDLIGNLVLKQGGFVCNGFLMKVQPEIEALVTKVLDTECHGPAIRNDDDV